MNEISGTSVVDSIAAAANGNIVNFGAFRTGGAPFDSTPPAAPIGLGATAGNGSVSLAWTANGEPDLAGYNVYRSTTPSVPLVSPLNGATLVATAAYLDGTAANGTTYYYVVTAVDTGSNQSGARTRSTPPRRCRRSSRPGSTSVPPARTSPSATPPSSISASSPSRPGSSAPDRASMARPAPAGSRTSSRS